MDAIGSITLRGWWPALIAVVVPILLVIMLVQELRTKIDEPYEGYPADLLNVFGWGMVVALPIIGIVLSLLPWRGDVPLEDVPDEEPEALVDGGEKA